MKQAFLFGIVTAIYDILELTSLLPPAISGKWNLNTGGNPVITINVQITKMLSNLFVAHPPNLTWYSNYVHGHET